MKTVKRLFEDFEPNHYNLTLDLARKERVFSGTAQVRGHKTSINPIVLHAKDLTIQQVEINGTPTQFTLADDEVTLTAVLPAGEYLLSIDFEGTITDGLHGLYPCYFELDGLKKELLATQFESHHAREVFPCIDEPEAKATFDLTLITESSVTALSNMPAKKSSQLQESAARQRTEFETTPRMSTYLLAFVVGELQSISGKSHSGVEVSVWSTKVHATSELAYALDIATRSIDFYESYFDTPYPLAKSDHVAIPDFSAAAMENWGLIIYREQALLASPEASLTTKQYVAKVVAHELSHQWFGNLVTMRWWNDLWLNESFARLMEYVCLDALEPNWKVWNDMTLLDAAKALQRDATDGVQAVQCEVRHPDEINTLFDTAIVYAKGSRLMYMLRQFVGSSVFQQALTSYFKTHAYKNTEAKDLWQAMANASGKNIADFMKTWLTQPGFPLVTVTENSISQRQFFIGNHPTSNQLWPLPLFSNSKLLPSIVESANLPVNVPVGTCINLSNQAHFITNYSAPHMAWFKEALADKTLEEVDRLKLIFEQTMLVEAEIQPADSLLALLDCYKQETSEAVWAVIITAAKSLHRFCEGEKSALAQLQQFYMELVKQPFADLGWAPRPDETEAASRLRADVLSLVVQTSDRAALQPGLKLYGQYTLEKIPASVRVPVLKAVLHHATDQSIFNTLFENYKNLSSPELKNDLMIALASDTNEEHRARLLASLTNAEIIRPQDFRLWLMYMLHVPKNRTATWAWLCQNWPWVEKTFKSDMSYDRIVEYCGMYLSTPAELEQFTEFFRDKRNQPALRRAVELGEIQIQARVKLIEHQKNTVINALQERVS